MNNYTIIRSDELYHHGILGQKWGVRRYQNEDGSLTEEGKRRYGSGSRLEKIKNGVKKAVKTADRLNSEYLKDRAKRAEDEARIARRHTKTPLGRWNSEKMDEKAELRRAQAEPDYYKNAVKTYRQKDEEFTNRQEKNDELWRDVAKARKESGKNFLDRTINSIKNSPEAKKYNQLFETWSKEQDFLDEFALEVNKSYLDTGDDFIQRLYNNIRY